MNDNDIPDVSTNCTAQLSSARLEGTASQDQACAMLLDPPPMFYYTLQNHELTHP